MSVSWNSLYTEICDILLESNPPGLSLGLLTPEQFWSIAAEVQLDFCAKTGFSKRLFCDTLHAGVQEYQLWPTMGEVQGTMAGQSFLFESSDFYLSNSDRAWEGPWNVGNPESYRQDSIQTQMIQISPAPQTEGNQIVVDNSSGNYGVIGAVASYSDFNITLDPSTPSGFGIIGGFNGNPYLETVTNGYGVPGGMIPSTGNLQMQSTSLPFQVDNLGPNTLIELVPDSLTPFLRYGVLARIFSGDNELKDLQKATFCNSLYTLGINTVAAIMTDVYQED